MRQVSEAVRRIRQVSRSRGQDTSSLANDFVWNTPLSGHAQEDRNSPAYDPYRKPRVHRSSRACGIRAVAGGGSGRRAHPPANVGRSDGQPELANKTEALGRFPRFKV